MLRTGVLGVTLLVAFSSANGQSHFQSCFSGTGGNASVLIDPAISPTFDGVPLAAGDEIAVFTPQGQCAGVAAWTGNVVGITIWADDETTSQVDGMSPGAPLHFVAWDKSTGREGGLSTGNVIVGYDATAPYRSSGTFENDAIYRLASLAANVPPTALFTLSTSTGPAPLTIDFDATVSSDGDGIVASYLWDFGNGQTATGAAVAHTFTEVGSYTVRLTVTDVNGATASTTRLVSATVPPNAAPTASFTRTPSSGTVPLVVQLNASQSSDSDGSITSYAWQFGDGTSGTGVTTSHTYNSVGSFTIRLTVTDDDGAMSSMTRTVNVDPPTNDAPNASFTMSPSSGYAPLAVTFSASGSSDADGTIVSYAWDYGEGSTGSGMNVNHTFASAGTYEVNLTVTDDDGATSSTSKPVVVSAPPNVPPTASFTRTPSTGVAPLLVTANGSASSDEDGSIVQYAWDFGDGSSASGQSASHTYATSGSYSIRLTVTDDDGASGSATLSVTVSPPTNVPPQASFTLSTSGGYAPLQVTVDASGSTDTDGSIVSYAWDFGDGGDATGVSATHTFETPGTYEVELVVTDDDGAQATQARTVTVTETPNLPPLAAFSRTPASGDAPLQVRVDAAASSDPDGTIVSYAWDFGDGTTRNGPSVNNTYNSEGSFTIRLTVTDDDGATAVATQSVVVTSSPNAAPDASFTQSGTSGTAPLNVSFDASGSTDSDGSIVSYAWTFGDGGSATGVTTTHTFQSAGSYEVMLVVTDNEGAESFESGTVTVSDPPNASPVAAFTQSTTGGEAPLNVSFNASGSSDSDGSIASYAWTFGDGATASVVSTSHTYTSDGSFTVRLTVTDDDGATSSATRTVNVTSTPESPPNAVFSMNPTSGVAPLEVSFNASGSTDDDGSIVSYAWDFDDGGSATGVTTSHRFDATGTFSVSLKVTDDDGNESVTSRSITVSAPVNVPPTASFERSPTSGDIPLVVTVDGSGSSDGDGSIASYAWTFGDGSSATGVSASHTYTSAGTFTIRLTVTDDAGATSTVTSSITATVPSNAAPIASFTLNASNGVVPLTVQFDASGSTDLDGTIDSYAWNFGDGATSTGVTTSHTFVSAGAFEVRLVVTDDEGAQRAASRTVTIAEPTAQSGLVLHLPMDETSGTVARDASGNGNDGSLVGQAYFEENGVFRGSVRFDGGIIDVDDHEDLNLSIVSERTVSVWFRVDDRFEAGRKQVIFEQGGVDRGLSMYLHDGSLYVGGWNIPESGWLGAFMTSTSVRSNQWHHVALVLDGSESVAPGGIQAFLDGVPIGSRPASQIWPHNDNIGVGAVNGRTRFHDGEPAVGEPHGLIGSVDDLRIYNEVLSDAQVAALYEAAGTLQNAAPTAGMVVTPPGGTAPATLTFDGTSSSDPDNDISVYRWSFGDGGAGTGSVVTHTYTNPGTFTASLTVEDASGLASSTSESVTITDATSNLPPVARFTVLELSSDPFVRVLDAGGSTDEDGVIDQYIWDFGDGATARDSRVTHAFPGSGVYNLQLTVVDNEGATNTRQSTVEIKQPFPLALEVASVGAVASAGAVLFDEDTWRIEAPGGAADLRADAFGYVHRVVIGDEQITIRVDSLENTDRWAFAGLMFRGSLGASVPHAAMTITPESGPVFAYRLVNDDWEIKSQGDLVAPPVWLRLIRSGDVFEGQYSVDGVDWVSAGRQTVAMSETVHAGIVASSSTPDQQATTVMTSLNFGPFQPQTGDLPPSHLVTDPYPNPFRSRANFSVSVSHPEHVHIAMYNVLGEKVAVIHDDELAPNSATNLEINADRLASGLYFVQVYGESFVEVVKMTIVK